MVGEEQKRRHASRFFTHENKRDLRTQ
jgi:hypothetical protein